MYINHKDGYHTRRPKWVEEKFGFKNKKDNVQLFNLKKDIGQKINLTSKFPKKVNELEKVLINQQKTETFKTI